MILLGYKCEILKINQIFNAMTDEPIIQARLKKFAESHNLDFNAKDELFEYFANYSILFQHQPDAFSADFELLDDISVGGGNDGGLDGVAIKVNGFLIKSKDEIDELLKVEDIDIEFIFIQSKNKQKCKSQEILAFHTGIRAFFDSTSSFPFSDVVLFWKNLKDYIYSDDVVCQWKQHPIVRCYYVVQSNVQDDVQRDSIIERFKSDMSTYCDHVEYHLIDLAGFRKILDRNDNRFSVMLPCIDTMELNHADKVENSCIAICKASDFIPIINTAEGIIKKSLFNDNVRDYQGFNSVNTEISRTIVQDPSSFVLFNNGITIVCTSFINNNRRLKIDNPQIVNGCQTSNVIFAAYKEGVDINDVTITIKVIATKDTELSNDIVRGTNRQNIVLEEAFEGTRQFHKDLENFMNNYQAEFQEKVYYERRTKQYANNPNIKQYQKINLKILTQYYIGAVLKKPYLSHLHESVLLKKFAGKIFLDNDSKLPYFAVAYAFNTLEKLILLRKVSKFFIKYKAHLLMIYFRMVSGKNYNLKVEKSADEYAQKVLNSLYNMETALKFFEEAVNIFDRAKRIWINDMHRSQHVMKENPDFTELLIKLCLNAPIDNLKQALKKEDEPKFGVIKRVIFKGYNSFGYILTDEEEYYFSKHRNKKIDFKELRNGYQVSFKLTPKDSSNRVQAYDIKLLRRQQQIGNNSIDSL